MPTIAIPLSRSPRLGAALSGILAALISVGAAVAETGLPQPNDDRKQALIHLVRQDCGSCHGMTLKGGLGGPLLPETLAGHDNDFLATVILMGIPGKPMPGWEGHLSHAEAIWIADQLKKGFPK